MPPKKYGYRAQLANDEKDPIGIPWAVVMSLEELTELQRRLRKKEAGRRL